MEINFCPYAISKIMAILTTEATHKKKITFKFFSSWIWLRISLNLASFHLSLIYTFT